MDEPSPEKSAHPTQAPPLDDDVDDTDDDDADFDDDDDDDDDDDPPPEPPAPVVSSEQATPGKLARPTREAIATRVKAERLFILDPPTVGATRATARQLTKTISFHKRTGRRCGSGGATSSARTRCDR
jgi:hypothetical protein